jgi:hypothetical protein
MSDAALTGPIERLDRPGVTRCRGGGIALTRYRPLVEPDRTASHDAAPRQRMKMKYVPWYTIAPTRPTPTADHPRRRWAAAVAIG